MKKNPKGVSIDFVSINFIVYRVWSYQIGCSVEKIKEKKRKGGKKEKQRDKRAVYKDIQ